jgi:hypothetical protein
MPPSLSRGNALIMVMETAHFGNSSPLPTLQVSLVHDDHMIQALPANTPNEALHVRVLPWTLGGNDDRPDPPMLNALPKVCAVNAIAVALCSAASMLPRSASAMCQSRAS